MMSVLRAAVSALMGSPATGLIIAAVLGLAAAGWALDRVVHDNSVRLSGAIVERQAAEIRNLKAAQQTLAEYVEKGRATLLERDENIAITERQLAIMEADNEKLRAASAAASDLSAPIFLANDPWWVRRKDAGGNSKPSAGNR